MKFDLGLWFAYFCFFGLPLLAVGLISLLSYQSALATGSSPWWGAFVGALIGIFVLGAFITASGNDMTDFAVNSIIVIILTIILMPVFMRAREKAYRRSVIKQELKRQSIIFPQPVKKGTQPSR